MYECDKCGEQFESRGKYAGHMSGHARNKATEGMLIDALQELAEEIGETPTMERARGELPMSITTYQDRFGSWSRALVEAGLQPNQHKTLTDEELEDELRRLADELGRTPSAKDIREHGKWSVQAYMSRYNFIRDAQAAAGLEPNEFEPGPNGEFFIQADELIDQLQRLDAELGRPPTTPEMRGRYDVYSIDVFQRVFGTWNNALKAADLPLHMDYDGVEVECAYCGETLERTRSRARNHDRHYCDFDCLGKWNTENNLGEDAPNWGGGMIHYYGPNWDDEREVCLDQYDHQCAICGISNPEHKEKTGQELHIHHVTPLEKYLNEDGTIDYDVSNRPENLVPLCSSDHPQWEGMPIKPTTA